MFEFLSQVTSEQATASIYYATRVIRHARHLKGTKDVYRIKGLRSEPSREEELLANRIISEIESKEDISLQDLSNPKVEEYIQMLADTLQDLLKDNLKYDKGRGVMLLAELRAGERGMDRVFRAFVIMPFDPEFDSIYEQLIKPSLVEAGYEVLRADNFTAHQNILRDIVEGIAVADLVIADLTTLNPNVFYELGLCHGLRIPTILLAQSMEDVPFDLRSYRVQIYETRFDQIHKLKNSLKTIAEKYKSGAVTFGSPIIDFYPQRIEAREVAAAVGAGRGGGGDAPEEENESEEEDEKGGADYAAEVEIAFEDMNSFITELGELNEEYTSRISGHTEQLRNLNENPQPGAASKKRAILSRAAADLNEWSNRLERRTPDFEESVESLDESFAGLIRFAEEPSTEEDRLGYANARKTFSEFAPKSHEATESFRELNAVVAGLRRLSKDMSRASRRFTQVFGNIIQTMEKVEAFAGRAVSLLDNKIGGHDTEKGEADN